MKAYDRTRQFIFSRFLHIFENRNQTILCENGLLSKTGDLLKKEKISNVFIVTSKSFVNKHILDPFLENCKENCIDTTIYHEVKPDPDIDCVEKGKDLYIQNNCQAIVAIGGGSVMDCSKLIGARVSCPNKTIPQMNGLLKIRKKIPNLYAMPTTAGTGSESTAAAVVTEIKNNVHYKYAVTDYCLIPHMALLDADLTLRLNPEMSATTGMDALTHAIEAYTNLYPSTFVQENAIKAIQLIFQYLPTVYKEPENMQARENMLRASNYAGLAFTNNFVGYVHALAHAIGAIYNLPHGLCCSILLPAVLEEYGSSIDSKLRILEKETNIPKNEFIHSIRNMQRQMNLPSTFTQLKEDDFEEIIKRARKESIPIYPTPQIWDTKQFYNVLKRVCD